MRISDWSSDVCSSDLIHDLLMALPPSSSVSITRPDELAKELFTHRGSGTLVRRGEKIRRYGSWKRIDLPRLGKLIESGFGRKLAPDYFRSEEHTSELQSLMRISYAIFCLHTKSKVRMKNIYIRVQTQE